MYFIIFSSQGLLQQKRSELSHALASFADWAPLGQSVYAVDAPGRSIEDLRMLLERELGTANGWYVTPLKSNSTRWRLPSQISAWIHSRSKDFVGREIPLV